MSCSGIRCRNKGSGYEKSSGGGGASSELDNRMKDLLAARAADDARIWGAPGPQTVSSGAVVAATTSTTTAAAKPSNTITYR